MESITLLHRIHHTRLVHCAFHNSRSCSSASESSVVPSSFKYLFHMLLYYLIFYEPPGFNIVEYFKKNKESGSYYSLVSLVIIQPIGVITFLRTYCLLQLPPLIKL
ncbi:uncharacterized protein EV154DRAFT_514227 [Mucor mucedo]|uniref:uncharacterized protein n=1 Tax=Mucor mucedo TaxID=29922 RepID=UPI002220C505|nr:uncharacterized protein EV154DRAFT_514227 [Mucor mucedo]KAI7889586.1 hypothetical protein EV154DRAFT_514227 [Mucor mucedo]